MVSKTKELNTRRYGAKNSRELSRQFWKHFARAVLLASAGTIGDFDHGNSGSGFQVVTPFAWMMPPHTLAHLTSTACRAA